MMKTTQHVLIMLLFIAAGCCFSGTLSAQGARDTAFFNNNGAGIPNSGNTISPSNAPEFPHSAPLNPTTDPGPMTPGTNGNMVDTVPHFRRELFKQ